MYNQLINKAVDGVLESIATWRAERYRPRSEWFRFYGTTGGKVEVYMRHEFFMFPDAEKGRMAECITVANIGVSPQKRGIGTQFITRLHDSNPCEFTCIENVHNEHLRRWAQAEGWLCSDPSYINGVCCSFHRPTGQPAVPWPFDRTVVVVPAEG